MFPQVSKPMLLGQVRPLLFCKILLKDSYTAISIYILPLTIFTLQLQSWVLMTEDMAREVPNIYCLTLYRKNLLILSWFYIININKIPSTFCSSKMLDWPPRGNKNYSERKMVTVLKTTNTRMDVKDHDCRGNSK